MSERVISARIAHADELHLREQFLLASQQEAELYRGHMEFRPQPTSTDMVCIVGTAGETAFGMLTMYPVDGTGWYIELLYVQPEARGIGIGSSMMEAAIAEVQQRGGQRLHAATLPGDRSTKNLFERHGLVAQMITVGKVL